MQVYTLPSGPFETNCYVVDCGDKKALIIDPAPESFDKIQHILNKHQLTPIALLLTHSNWDHIAQASDVKKNYSIPIYIHPRDKDNLIQPGSDMLPCWIQIQGVNPDHLFTPDEKLVFNNLECHVIETPGHTPGGVCFYFPNEGVLFSGDTLFQGTIGNISFATARPKEMWPSLQKLSKLPANTLVYPGHGASTTIGKEPWLPDAERLFS
jgi:glyoxylase-like metal-dependent hydrolase (beta-lactamase superfamily II)